MMINAIYQNKTVNESKLISFGFVERNGGYVYKTELLNGQFQISVEIDARKELKTKVIDKATQDEYTLHLVSSACGTFVGNVRAEYERVLTEICDRCYDTEIFKSDYAHKAIEYARKTYGDEPEYLWEKFPSNAVWRRKDNKKWYGALLTVSEKKLGIDGDKNVEIIDLRIESDKIESLIDGKKYFAGYHMNKKHWFTMRLNGSVPFEEICEWIDRSYILAKNK